MSDFLERIAKLSPKRLALLAADLNSKLDRLNRRESEPIAVIGMGCRFPGDVDDPDSFWRLMIEGGDAIREVPAGRWDVDKFYDPDPDAPGKMSTRWGGFLKGIDQFDPEFFGISPREAAGMDPQQRLLLEVTWEALENAGQNPARLAGSPTGVFVGICNSDYFLKRFEGARGSVDAYVATGNAHSVASGRISYILGLKGPSLSVDTACSSSLTAVHLACQSLRAGECRMALAGGVNLILMPDTTILLSKSHMMSPDGRCKPFDTAADGFVRSEGCGIVSLKLLSEARADGDTILALIRGTACNQDGHSSGLTAPNGPSQVAIIREALANAGLQAGDVDFVEAHGTGTSLGDPIEARALAEVFGPGRASGLPLRVGSVKSNIGHAESAAGIAGLIKTILALRHGKIPPTLHLKELNPHIDWNGLAIGVPILATSWNRERGRRVAGVSSFGFSGTNAHVILSDAAGVEEVSGDLARHAAPGHDSAPLQLLPLAARSESALAELARRYGQLLGEKPDLNWADVCYTAGTGRAHFEYRLTIVAADGPEAQERLADFQRGKKHDRVCTRRSLNSVPPAVVFMFTGQGSQYAGMGRELYATQPVFQRELDKCAEILKPLLDKPLLELLFGEGGESGPGHFLDQTQYTQPALFALEFALAAMWRSWGVEPSMVLGHSVGEYVAACVAGVFGLEDGLHLITERGRLMATLPAGGTMAAVFAEESRVSAAIAGTGMAIACLNGPANVVISGENAAMSAVLDRLEKEGIRSKRLVVSHAFHSSMMDPILDPFQRAAERLAYSEPLVAIVSNVTGRIATPGLMSRPEYWRGHIRNPVQFAASIRTLRESGQSIFLEIGPHPVLTGLARMSVPEEEVAWGASLDRAAGNWECLLESVSMLYLHGVELEWDGLHAMRQPKRIALPTYPFQRARYWLEQTKTRPPLLQDLSAEKDPRIHPLLGKRLDSPAIAGAVFEHEMGEERPAFLNDHRIFGRLIMPSPAYIEMAMAGAARLLGLERTESLPCEIVDLVIREPLFLPEEGATRVQLIFEDSTERGRDFKVCSKEPSSEAAGRWRTHVTGSLKVGGVPRHLQTQTWNREEVWSRCSVEMDAGSYYDSLVRLGLEFGERFRGIISIRRGNGEALAEIQLPETLANEVGPYLIHPALLDSCFHLLGAALPREDVQNAYLLIGIESFALLTAPPNRFWNHTVLRPGAGSGSEVFSGDIRLYSEDGRIVAEIIGLHLKRATALAMERSDEKRPESCFYEIAWREQAIAATADKEADGSGLTADFIPKPVLLTGIAREELHRLTLSEHLGIYAEFLPKLESLSAAYIQRAFLRMGWSLSPGEHRTARELAEESGVLPNHRRLFERLIGVLVEVGVLEPERDGWTALKLMEVQSSDLQLEAEHLKQEFPACSAEVTLTARCAERLDEVLRGTCDPLQLLFPNGDFDTAHALYRTSPFARALNTALRHVVVRAIQDAPKDRLVRILEIGAGTGGTTSFLLPSLPTDQTRYTFSDVSPLFLTRARDEFRNYQFAQFELLDIEKAPPGQGFSDESFDVIIAANIFHATRDLRETLAHAAALLAPGGVLILLEGTRRQRWVDLTFGLTDGWWRFEDTDLRPDYALISAEQWKPLFRETGLEVEHSTGSSEALESVPQTILIGQKPLSPKKIDLAPGSPGFWVIFIDSMGIGEEVATLISRLGEACILVSKGTEYEFTDGRWATLDPVRPLDFARLFSEAVAVRNGQLRGVLNLWPVDEEVTDTTTSSEWEASQARLGGGVLHATQALLALQSAEISREARLWFVTRGAQAVPSQSGSTAESFQPVQALVWGLARVISLEQPARFGSVIDLDLRTSPQDCAAAIWDEMKHTDAEEAVAYRNGKRRVPRVVRAAEPCSESLILQRDGSYLITGGLGGLGLQIAEWMTARGAGHIVLLSRRHFPERSHWGQLAGEDPNYRAVQRILEAEKIGARIAVAQGDVADENGMRTLFQRFGKGEPPLRGIIHAAAEMTTRPIGELDLELFQRMCRAKALGGWVLHRLTFSLDLDLFVFFSSTTALWGAAGLGHYAAANQALDLLAYWRRERGMRALSVNWGTWQEMRVASEADKEQFIRAGLHPMPGAQALDALERVIATDQASAIVASVDWSALRAVYEGRRLRPLFDEMRFRPRFESEAPIPSKSAGTQPEFRLQLQNASPARRRTILITLLRSQISSILGFDLSREIEVEQGLFDMGMDSLMSVELKGRLERSLGIPLPSTLTFNYPTIKALVDYLLSEALGFDSAPPRELTTLPPGPAIAPPVVSASDDLSEEELSELLLKKLEELEE